MVDLGGARLEIPHLRAQLLYTLSKPLFVGLQRLHLGTFFVQGRITLAAPEVVSVCLT